MLDRFGGCVEADIDGSVYECPKNACRWPIPLGQLARRYSFASLLSMRERTQMSPIMAAQSWLGYSGPQPWVPEPQLAEFKVAHLNYARALRFAFKARRERETQPLVASLVSLAEAADAVRHPMLASRIRTWANAAVGDPSVLDESDSSRALRSAYLVSCAMTQLWSGHPLHSRLLVVDPETGVHAPHQPHGGHLPPSAR